jgi:hypothetical protein
MSHTLNEDTRAALLDLLDTLRDLPLEQQLRDLDEIRLTVAYATGERARGLAAEQSWAAVGAVVGTSREAAWQKWH